MLSNLETRIADALKKDLPADAIIYTGPAVTPKSATEHSVNIFAKELKTLAANDEDRENKRDPAFLTQRHQLQGDGHTLDFPLNDADGELTEVEISPGYLARPGDHYLYEPGMLRFYRAPAGPFHVLIRGKRTSGYRETVKGSVLMEISLHADQAAALDALTSTALASLLTAFANLDFVLFAEESKLGFQLRLLKPQANLQSLERDVIPVDSAKIFETKIRLELRGELEITLAAGLPEEESRIQTLEGKLNVVNTPAKQQGFRVSEK